MFTGNNIDEGVPAIETLMNSFESHNSAVAFIQDELRVSYKELVEHVYRVSRTLRKLEVNAGECVAIMSGNRFETVLVRYAAQVIGCRTAHVDARLSVEQQARLLADVEAKYLIFDDSEFGERVAELQNLARLRNAFGMDGVTDHLSIIAESSQERSDPVPIEAEVGKIGTFHFSTGTTAQPKCVARPFAPWVNPLYHSWSGDEGSIRLLLCPSVNHLGSLLTDIVLSTGGSVELHNGFDAAAFSRRVAEGSVTHTYLLPSMIYEWIDWLEQNETDCAQYRGLRTVLICGAVFSSSRLQKFSSYFGNIIENMYGSNEAGLVTLLRRTDYIEGNEAVSSGFPLSGVSVEIRDDGGEVCPSGVRGQIVVRSPHVMSGYWKRHDECEVKIVDGWLWTSDLGSIDDIGKLEVHGRMGDRMNRGGEHVYPADVESALMRHDAVVDAAAVTVPGKDDLDCMAAAIVLNDEIEVDELRGWMLEEVGRLFVPHVMVVVDRLPLNSNGKVNRTEIVSLASAAMISETDNR